MKKDNKSITVTSKKITVNYHDSAKHFTYNIEKGDPNRDIKLFGKQFKGVKAADIKKDFFNKEQREIFDDLLYAKHRMSKSEIEALPLMKQYRVKVLSREVEKTLTKWKAEVVSASVDALLLKLFPKSPIVKQFVEVQPDEKDTFYPDSFNIHSMFSELEIAEYLASKGLFPKLN